MHNPFLKKLIHIGLISIYKFIVKIVNLMRLVFGFRNYVEDPWLFKNILKKMCIYLSIFTFNIFYTCVSTSLESA